MELAIWLIGLERHAIEVLRARFDDARRKMWLCFHAIMVAAMIHTADFRQLVWDFAIISGYLMRCEGLIALCIRHRAFRQRPISESDGISTTRGRLALLSVISGLISFSQPDTRLLARLAFRLFFIYFTSCSITALMLRHLILFISYISPELWLLVSSIEVSIIFRFISNTFECNSWFDGLIHGLTWL